MSAPFNLLDDQLLREPVTGYARIREQIRLAPATVPGLDRLWLVTRYDDVRLVLSDRRFVTRPPGPNLAEQVLQARGIPPEHARYLVANILDTDGADHDRLRTLVAPTFSRRRMAALRPRVEELADDLLDRLPAEADLLREFAYPLPITVICELLGVPEDDRAAWRAWSAALTSPSGEGMAAAVGDLVAYTQQLVDDRRRLPADDLVTALVQAQNDDGGRLTDIELISLVITLLVAGHETTAHLIGNGALALLTHPDQLERLRAEPDLMPRAVDELLRWCGPALATRMRYATEDIAFDGATVRAGEAVMPMLVAANHDPRRFSDPDRLDVARDPGSESHVAFAHGPHYCLGAALARLEGEVAFTALLRRFPSLALAGTPERELTLGAWRLATLPVRFSHD